MTTHLQAVAPQLRALGHDATDAAERVLDAINASTEGAVDALHSGIAALVPGRHRRRSTWTVVVVGLVVLAAAIEFRRARRSSIPSTFPGEAADAPPPGNNLRIAT